ncbi:MAG: diguanylate cyclase domain-containing protein [Bulleidia sp.]
MRSDMYDQETMDLIHELRTAAAPSEKAADRLLQIGRSMQEEHLLGIGFYFKARIHFQKSLEMDETLSELMESVTHAEAAHDYDTLAAAYTLLGIVSDIHCNYPLAAGYFIRARGYCAKTELSQRYLAVVAANISHIFYEVHEYQKAEFYNAIAMEKLQQMPDDPQRSQDLSSCHVVAASLALEMGPDIRKAEAECAEAESSRGKEGWDEISELDVLITKMRIAGAKNDREEVLSLFREFLPKQKQFPVTADAIDNLLFLISLLIRLRETEACRELFAYLDSSLNTEIPGVLMKFYDLRMQLAKVLGDQEEEHRIAMKYYEASCRKLQEEDRAAVIAVEGSLSGAKLAEENVRLLKEAEADALTGLANRYGLNRHAEEVYEICYRKQQNLGVEILDVDFFKEYNDSYGHPKGDACLQAAAEVLKQLAAEDPRMYPARYGGDEMVVVYENMSPEEMEEKLKRISERIRGLKIPHAKSKASPYVTVSQGLYWHVPKPENRLWDYTSGADYALYYVKNHHKGSWFLTKHSIRKGTQPDGVKGWED